MGGNKGIAPPPWDIDFEKKVNCIENSLRELTFHQELTPKVMGGVCVESLIISMK